MSTLILSENIATVFGLSTDNGILAASLYPRFRNSPRKFLWLMAMMTKRTFNRPGATGGEPLVIGQGKESKLVRAHNTGFETFCFEGDYLIVNYFMAKDQKNMPKCNTTTFLNNLDKFNLVTVVKFDKDQFTYAAKEAYRHDTGVMEFQITSRGDFTNRAWYLTRVGQGYGEGETVVIDTYTSPEMVAATGQTFQSFVKTHDDGIELTQIIGTAQGYDYITEHKRFSVGDEGRLLARADGGFTTVCSYEGDLLTKTKRIQDGLAGANYFTHAEYSYVYDEDNNPDSDIYEIILRTYTTTVGTDGSEQQNAGTETRFNFGLNDTFFRFINEA